MKKIFRNIMIIMLLLIFVCSGFNQNVKAAEDVKTRDVVLVLDVSESMEGKPFVAMKKATIKFSKQLIANNDGNRISIVSYSSSIDKTLDFTSDIDKINEFVESLTCYGGTNIEAGLKKADELFSKSNGKIKKGSIILLTDGIPVRGNVSYSGRYDSIGISSSCKYANYIYEYYNSDLKDKYNVYTFGFFHSLGGYYEYAKTFLLDIQNKGYYEVTDPEKLMFTFEDLASDIKENDDEKNCPIIIVPGIMGSRLYDNNYDYLIWEPGPVDIAGRVFEKNFTMDKTVDVHNYEYVDNKRVPINQSLRKKGKREYGATDIYKNLVDTLVDKYIDSNGKVTKNVYFFSYDFRQSNAESSNKLKKFIEAVLSSNPECSKVDIVAHSMGGLVVSDYVAKNKDNKIRKVITCGTPYEGAPKLIYSAMTDKVLDSEVNNFFIELGGLSREIKTHFPSLAELAPTMNYVEKGFKETTKKIVSWNVPTKMAINNGYARFGFYETSGKAIFQNKPYTLINAAIFKGFMNWIFDDNYDAAIDFHKGIRDYNGENVLLKLDNSYFIVGEGQKTISDVFFNDINFWMKSFGNYQLGLKKLRISRIFYTQGDGTVPYMSATMLGDINNKLGERFVPIRGSHVGIVSEETGINVICNILDGKSNAYIKNKETGKKGYIVVSVFCPVDVEISKNGETLKSDIHNLNTETSFGVLNFIGDNYDGKSVCIDEDEYEVKLNATEEGKMDFIVDYYNSEDELEKSYVFSDVSLSNGMLMNTITLKDGMVLNVDKDGDGVIDYTIEPDEDSNIDENIIIEKTDSAIKYKTGEFEVEYDIISRYNDCCNVKVVITNNSNETIHNWKLVYDKEEDIENIWNGSADLNNGKTIVKNMGYNQDIAVGGSVSFGFISKEKGVIVFPNEFLLVSEKNVPNTTDYEVKFEKTADWEKGYNGVITITNVSNEILYDWTVSFTLKEEISGVWNGEIIKHDGNTYEVTNKKYNHNILPGQSVSIGFTVSDCILHDIPNDFVVTTIN